MTSKISRLLPSPKPQFLSLISIRRIFERAQVSCEKTENWIICDCGTSRFTRYWLLCGMVRTYTLLCRMSIIMVAVPKNWTEKIITGIRERIRGRTWKFKPTGNRQKELCCRLQFPMTNFLTLYLSNMQKQMTYKRVLLYRCGWVKDYNSAFKTQILKWGIWREA